MGHECGDELYLFIKIDVEFLAGVSFDNERSTWFFGHSFLHWHGSTIQTQFLYNFACKIIAKKNGCTTLMSIILLQYSSQVAHSSISQSQKIAWLEETFFLVKSFLSDISADFTIQWDLGGFQADAYLPRKKCRVCEVADSVPVQGLKLIYL